jgi:regulator of nucleoside diphosphate kinase
MTTNDHALLPDIVLCDSEYASLSNLAAEAEQRLPGVGEPLLIELNRAAVVAADELPDDIVRMGSRVLYRADSQVSREVKLVYPGHADIAEGRISVMTPFGAALIGMKQGASIDWTARDGREHRLTVLRVTNERGDPSPGPQAA